MFRDRGAILLEHVKAERGQGKLLEHGAEVDRSDANGRSALHQAAPNGHNGVVRALLEKGANANATDGQGETALHLAAESGFRTVAGADEYQGLTESRPDRATSVKRRTSD